MARLSVVLSRGTVGYSVLALHWVRFFMTREAAIQWVLRKGYRVIA